LGHTGFNRFKRILDNGDSSTAFDRERSRRPIVKSTSQNYSEHALTVSAGGAAKKGINRRSMAIFPRPTRKQNLAIVEHEVAIGRSHVNAATFDLVSFPGLDDRNRPAAVKNAAECTGGAGEPRPEPFKLSLCLSSRPCNGKVVYYAQKAVSVDEQASPSPANLRLRKAYKLPRVLVP
jgi:hypothetical protein